MVNQSFIAIARIRPGVKENSIGSRPDGRPDRGGNVDAGVESSFSREGVHPLSEACRDDPPHRPNRRSSRVFIDLFAKRGGSI